MWNSLIANTVCLNTSETGSYWMRLSRYNVKNYIIYVDSSYNKVPVHTFVIARLQSSDVSWAIRGLSSSVLQRPFLHLTLVSITAETGCLRFSKSSPTTLCPPADLVIGLITYYLSLILTRDFSCTVSGFGQVFLVDRAGFAARCFGL